MKEVHAHLRFLRQSPRKVRLVADLIRGHKAQRAVNTLSVLNKVAAPVLLKLLKSAMANATHNFSLEENSLRITQIMVDGQVFLVLKNLGYQRLLSPSSKTKLFLYQI
jgi:large subunit ribosomal protein L22